MTIKELCTKVREAAEAAARDPGFPKVVCCNPQDLLPLLGRIEELERDQITQYDLDMIAIADMAANVVMCRGGRPIMHGYMCLHCGADPDSGCDGRLP